MARLRWKSISVCEFWPVLRSFRQSFAPLISHSLPHAVLPPSSSQAAVEVYFNCEVWLVFRSFKQSFVPSIRPSLLQSLCGNGSPSLHQLRVYSLRSTFCFRALSESLSLGPHLQRSQYTLHKTIGRPRLIKESKGCLKGQRTGQKIHNWIPKDRRTAWGSEGLVKWAQD